MHGLDSQDYVVGLPSDFNARKILMKRPNRESYYICVWNGLTQITFPYTQETIDTLRDGTHNVYKTFQFWNNFKTTMINFMVDNLDNFKSMEDDGDYNWEWIEQETSKIISEIVESQDETTIVV